MSKCSLVNLTGKGHYEAKVQHQAWRVSWLGPPRDSECHTSEKLQQ